MASKNIAAYTLPGDARDPKSHPGYVSFNKVNAGVEITLRADGDYNKIATLTISENEFKQLIDRTRDNGY